MKPRLLDNNPPERIFAPMYGIVRLPGGWQIRLGEIFGPFYHSSSYFDSKHGGKKKALVAAQMVRDKQIRQREFIAWVKENTPGAYNTTGFFGISCNASNYWCDRRANYYRRARFYVREEGRRNVDGTVHYGSFSFATMGAWRGYVEAVRRRAQFVREPVSNKVIAEQYDQVFLVNWRAKLDDLGVNWQRDG